jgi:hypothetical protein
MLQSVPRIRGKDVNQVDKIPIVKDNISFWENAEVNSKVKYPQCEKSTVLRR